MSVGRERSKEGGASLVLGREVVGGQQDTTLSSPLLTTHSEISPPTPFLGRPIGVPVPHNPLPLPGGS